MACRSYYRPRPDGSSSLIRGVRWVRWRSITLAACRRWETASRGRWSTPLTTTIRNFNLFLLIRLAIFSTVVFLSACSSVRSPDLGHIYDRAARYHDAKRNPVIVIPGVLGSRLVSGQDGTVAWGAFGGGAANPEKASGARLVALPMRRDAALRELTDEVVTDGSLDRIELNLFGLPISLNAYAQILGSLGAGGYRDETLGSKGAIDYGDDHYTCFQFDYDWRRDIAENAQRFGEFIKAKRTFVQAQVKDRFGIEDAEVRFDVVAHSMGGLVARYYLRYGERDPDEVNIDSPPAWDGAADIDRLIMVGTPNGGSTKALEQLVGGAKFASILPKYEPAVLGTMPALYEMLPRNRQRAVVKEGAPADAEPIDLYDVNVWVRNGWGLADTAQDRVLRQLLPEAADADERRDIALDHLAKCLRRAKRFNALMDRRAAPPSGTTLFLLAGDAIDTPSRLAISKSDHHTYPVGTAPGDGTVTRASALLDERVGRSDAEWRPRLDSPIAWKQVTFLFRDHLGLTTDPMFTDNVLFTLLESP